MAWRPECTETTSQTCTAPLCTPYEVIRYECLRRDADVSVRFSGWHKMRIEKGSEMDFDAMVRGVIPVNRIFLSFCNFSN